MKELYEKFAQQYKEAKVVEADLKAKKQALEATKMEIIQTLEEFGTTTYKGTQGTISITTTTIPNAENWEQVYNYIYENKAFDLLQKRLSSTAWRDRIDADEFIPGLQSFNKKTVKFNSSN